jgi:hypothetical protein
MDTKQGERNQDHSPEQGTVQPATREEVRKGGVPGDDSSKARPGKTQDQRSAHDKDGNQEQAAPARREGGER